MQLYKAAIVISSRLEIEVEKISVPIATRKNPQEWIQIIRNGSSLKLVQSRFVFAPRHELKLRELYGKLLNGEAKTEEERMEILVKISELWDDQKES